MAPYQELLPTPCEVEVHGLINGWRLNGCRGRAERLDAESGGVYYRVTVHGAREAAKRGNMCVVAHAQQATRAEPGG